MTPSNLSINPARRIVYRLALAAVGMLAAAGFATLEARAEDLIVKFDQSQILRLPRPAAEIIVGNPSIADVAIQSGNILVITGKSFGITNIIALDAERNVIQDQRVMVERDERNVVNMYRGVQRQTFACTPNCSPMLTIGDDNDFFTKILGHNGSKTKAAESGSESDRGGGQ